MKRLAILILLAATASAQTILVDATDARRGIFHTHETLPVSAGPLTLVYPKWIPGEHTPTGPLMQMAGLHIRAGEKELAWTRDRVDMFAFRVDVPAGVKEIDVDFDYMSASKTFGGGYGESANATQNLLLILFNHHVLYPAGVASDKYMLRPTVKLPEGWKAATALPGDAPVSLTTLVDSPIVAGLYQRIIPITDKTRLALTADSPQALAIPESRVANLRKLAAEADALFGARHFNNYTWLVTLSDLIEPQGLEHHESTDIRANEHAMVDADWAARTITILSHEFVHSWNGKYRRPAGLATPDYQQPMIGELLFLYEGMTRYLGDLLLSARSGMRTLEEDREFAASVAANMDRNRPGRTWRPLVDTSAGVSSFGDAPGEGTTYRRSWGDYYDESMLVWLDADTTIRNLTKGAKSLDDFAKLFFGGTASGPMLKPYTLDDVVTALNQVAPNDWKSFIESRVYRVNAHPPLGALENSGWRLVYNDTPNTYVAMRERTGKETNVSLDLGMWVKNDGTISDVVFNGPAFAAGLTAGMKINAVNGRKYDGSVLREELRAKKPLEFSVEQGTFAGTFKIDYRGGEQYPHLERIADRPDLLSDIMRPKSGL
jgi:predicted metalloprotease with PDZ domain